MGYFAYITTNFPKKKAFPNTEAGGDGIVIRMRTYLTRRIHTTKMSLVIKYQTIRQYTIRTMEQN